MRVPYNNGKVQMGINHQPEPYIETDPDMIILQSYLIQDPKLLRKQYWLKKAYCGAFGFVMLVVWLFN